jgi:hypothetical protein
MFVNRLEQIEQSCGSFGQTVSEEKILKKITHQKPSVFVIYRRRKFVFAIRLGSIQTSMKV